MSKLGLQLGQGATNSHRSDRWQRLRYWSFHQMFVVTTNICVFQHIRLYVRLQHAAACLQAVMSLQNLPADHRIALPVGLQIALLAARQTALLADPQTDPLAAPPVGPQTGCHHCCQMQVGLQALLPADLCSWMDRRWPAHAVLVHFQVDTISAALKIGQQGGLDCGCTYVVCSLRIG